MNILALDTATEACSVALRLNGVTTTRYAVEPRAHARLVLPMVDELLSEAEVTFSDLDALAFGRGPGAFTGLRIAAAVAQGLAVANNLSVVPVSNLAAMAWAQFRQHGHRDCLTAIDARMNEIYWAAWRCSESGAENTIAEVVVAAESALLPSESGDFAGVGTGWGVAGEVLRARGANVLAVDAEALPHARDIAELAELEFAKRPVAEFSPERALPVYLRNDVAKKSVSRLKSA